MAAATFTLDPTGSLTQSQHREVSDGRDRAKKIRRAAGVAGFNGWTIGIFAALSAPFALFSLAGFVLTAGMGVVAYNEFRGQKRLLQFDESAPTFLGWNQLGFLGLLVVYCLWMMLSGLTGPSPIAEEMNAKPELREILGSPEELDGIFRLVVAGFYSLVIVLCTLFQGGNAIYYFTRRKPMQAYLISTPAWVREVHVANA